MTDRYEMMQIALLCLIAAGVSNQRWLRAVLYLTAAGWVAVASVENIAHFVGAMK